jgi:hypothetical protein
MLWLFLAQLAAPVAIKPTKWLTPNDVPVESLPMDAQPGSKSQSQLMPPGKLKTAVLSRAQHD